MFNAIEPIYDQFFNVLTDNFMNSAGENLVQFKKLEKGFSLPLTRTTLTADMMPYGSLEWCQIDRVSGYRMPESYQYEMRIPFLIIAQSSRIYKDGTIDTFFARHDDHHHGFIGDLTRDLGGFFWRAHHTSRFSAAVDMFEADESGDDYYNHATDWDWSIVDFSMDVTNPLLVRPSNDSPLLQKFREVLDKNPLCRGTQMNFYFKVEERKTML